MRKLFVAFLAALLVIFILRFYLPEPLARVSIAMHRCLPFSLSASRVSFLLFPPPLSLFSYSATLFPVCAFLPPDRCQNFFFLGASSSLAPWLHP